MMTQSDDTSPCENRFQTGQILAFSYRMSKLAKMVINMANYHTINGCNLKFILVRTKQTPTLNRCAMKT